MAISKITTPLNNIELLGKINEIIDEINNYATTKPCVSNIAVSGTSIVVSFSDGSSHSIHRTQRTPKRPRLTTA